MKLSLKQIQTELPFNINRGLAAFRLDEFYKEKYTSARDAYTLDWDVWLPSKGMNLQRPFVWTLEQKQELMISFFKGINISKMTFIHYNHRVFRVIDGKQRLSTLISFAKGEFYFTWEGFDYYYDDLDLTMQRYLDFHHVTADVGYEYPDKLISDDHKIKWFELINFTGTPQDKQHLINLKK